METRKETNQEYSANAARATPMARTRSKTKEGSGLAAFFFNMNFKKNLLFFLVFLGAASIGWGIMSVVQDGETQVSWRSCLMEQGDGSLYPQLVEVPAGVYELPVSMMGSGTDQVMSAEIGAPFLIQTEEVALKQFTKYADYVAALPEGIEKERLMVRLGVQWNKAESMTAPINAVSWEGAWDFANWVGQKTGCAYRIPSQKEWVATVSYLQSRDQVALDGTVPPTGALRNLLWGVREWSRSSCSSGYFLLGRDDYTTGTYEEQAACMPAMFAVAGFRLVLNPTVAEKVAEGKEGSESR